MEGDYKIWAHKTGIILITQKELLVRQLRQNSNFFELPIGELKNTPLPHPLAVFVSKDIAPDIRNSGLPGPVKKFLAAV